MLTDAPDSTSLNGGAAHSTMSNGTAGFDTIPDAIDAFGEQLQLPGGKNISMYAFD